MTSVNLFMQDNSGLDILHKSALFPPLALIHLVEVLIEVWPIPIRNSSNVKHYCATLCGWQKLKLLSTENAVGSVDTCQWYHLAEAVNLWNPRRLGRQVHWKYLRGSR